MMMNPERTGDNPSCRSAKLLYSSRGSDRDPTGAWCRASSTDNRPTLFKIVAATDTQTEITIRCSTYEERPLRAPRSAPFWASGHPDVLREAVVDVHPPSNSTAELLASNIDISYRGAGTSVE